MIFGRRRVDDNDFGSVKLGVIEKDGSRSRTNSRVTRWWYARKINSIYTWWRNYKARHHGSLCEEIGLYANHFVAVAPAKRGLSVAGSLAHIARRRKYDIKGVFQYLDERPLIPMIYTAASPATPSNHFTTSATFLTVASLMLSLKSGRNR